MSALRAGRATFSSAASRRRARGYLNALDPERGLPALAALVAILVGALLVWLAQSAAMREASRGLRARTVVNLATTPGARALGPALEAAVEDADDRAYVAERVAEWLGERGGRLSHVGALASIRVPAAEVAARGDLGPLRERARAHLARRDPPETMALLTGEQVRALKPGFVVRAPGRFHGAFASHALLLVLAFAVAQLAVHARGRLGDPVLLPAATLLAGIGFVTLAGMRDPLRDTMLFERFAQGAALGAFAFAALAQVRFERSVVSRLALVPLLGALLLSAALAVLGAGPQGSDARVNLFGVQPVEVIRLLLVLFLAGWFADRWQRLRDLHEPPNTVPRWLRWVRLPRRRHALPVAVGVAAAILLFFVQRDLGPALILLALFLAMFAVTRASATTAVLGLGALAAAWALGYAAGFPSTVSLRTAMWLAPWDNGRAGGDQIAHALWGFAAGGIGGTGPGLGLPALMPAAHTDLVLAAVGEELGFAGILVCAALYAALVWRGLRIARDAPDAYSMFLALGLTLGLALQTLLIAGGVLGLAPLTGVVTPFLSYGRSALILHFATLGMLWAVSASASERRDAGEATPDPALARAFTGPLRALATVLAVLGGAVLGKAAWVQVVRADPTLGRGALARQADGELRYQYNPRLLEVAGMVPRGDVLDRNGVPLATSRWSVLERRRDALRGLGVDLEHAVRRADPRHYPFGGATYHLLGDAVSRRDWGASNTAFLERAHDAYLSGYDDHATVTTIRDPATGATRRVVRRDLRELVPLWRHRHEPGHRDVAAFLKRPRDVKSTVDVRLQLRAMKALRERLAAAGLERGAAVVIDAARGEVLASASWPAPDGPIRGAEQRFETAVGAASPDSLADPADGWGFDRARFGLYPPGSTFKLVTAAAALARDPAQATRVRYDCRPVGGGRNGTVVEGRLVRDDPTDREPHGSVAMEEATIVSCNAYYARLGHALGWEALDRAAHAFGIDTGSPTAEQRAAHAIEASYGQAHVVASPVRMARVAAAIANDGVLAGPRWTTAPRDSQPLATVMDREHARLLGRYMRGVVERGTAQGLARVTPRIAGKTGTAQVAGEASHSWFVGYAPAGDARRRIAFAVLVEHGGYGGVRAAPIAGDLVAAARDLGLLR